MKVSYFILNWDRDVKDVKKNIATKIPGEKPIVFTNQVSAWNGVKCIKDVFEADESVAKTKNKMLKYAKEELKSDFCFIIEDDIDVKDKSGFEQYISLMKKYKLPVAMFGYSAAPNTVLNNRPNPITIINDGRGRSLYINRYPCGSMTCFKISEDLKFFDERLQMFETEFLMEDIFQKNESNDLKNLFGFYFDITESWKFFKRRETVNNGQRTRIPTVRNKNKTLVEQDFEVRKRPERSMFLDEVIKYIKTNREN